MTTAKRTFKIGKENKESVCVEIVSQKDGHSYEGRFPKSEIKITNRQYTWGGGRWADIEFPTELSSLLKINGGRS